VLLFDHPAEVKDALGIGKKKRRSKKHGAATAAGTGKKTSKRVMGNHTLLA
jgi:hypothetical protein